MDIFAAVIAFLFIASFRKKKRLPFFAVPLRIEGFEHIWISPIVKLSGSAWIWNSKTNYFYKCSKNKKGYWRVYLPRGDGKGSKYFHVHRLLAITFIPNPNGYEIVDHINRTRSDNSIENLRWVTRQENAKQMEKKTDKITGTPNYPLIKIPLSYMKKETYMNPPEVDSETSYSLSRDGYLYSEKVKRFLSGRRDEEGYVIFDFKINGERFRPYLHDLLARMFIENPDKEKYTIVDHKDRTTSNNSLENLRWATPSMNSRNYSRTEGFSSKYYGVHWHEDRHKWVVVFEQQHIGYFEIEEMAARAYDKKTIEKFEGKEELFTLNFPDDIEGTKNMETIPSQKKKTSKYRGVSSKREKWRATYCTFINEKI